MPGLLAMQKNGNQMASTIILVENGGGGGPKFAAPGLRVSLSNNCSIKLLKIDLQ
ncbi:MAG: hypothetical protein CM1200mP10_05750 [Candidatus Neomarinimicrobiota bacterium]|nr:MAG: hypothetical protein CM1200mP10_05750 [Candidatus Neomarinimicrobiota bacterium]